MLLDTLLCPISLSRNSLSVLRTAGYLVSRTGVRLRLLHVLDPRDVSAVAHLSSFQTPPLETTARLLLKSRFEQALAPALRSNIEWEAQVVEGYVDDQIARAAKDRRVDLIVMGFKQASEPCAVHWLDRVLHQVRKSVLAVPVGLQMDPAGNWRNIVLATNLEDHCDVTHAAAGAMARITGADLTVVYVAEDLHPPVAAPDVLRVPDYRGFELAEATRKLEQAFEPVWPEAERLVLEGGEAGEEIARLARKKTADLVVVGYRSDRSHLLGSVADRILNNTVCPVLVVPHAGSSQQVSAA